MHNSNDLSHSSEDNSPEKSSARYQSFKPHETDLLKHLASPESTIKEQRLLALLQHPSTRRCAEVILNLELLENKTINMLNLQDFLIQDNDVSEEIKLFAAAQFRRQMLARNHYECWFNYDSTLYTESLWYPPEYCELHLFRDYLSTKQIKTPYEVLFLQLLLDPRTQGYAVEIFILTIKSSLIPYEQYYLKYLSSPNAQLYAHLLADFATSNDNPTKINRYFELLKDPGTRPYAMDMVTLEFKRNRTLKEEQYFNYFKDPVLRPYIALIKQKEGIAYQNLSPNDRDVLQYAFLYIITPKGELRLQTAYQALSLLGGRAKKSARLLLANAEDPSVTKEEMIQNEIDLKSIEIIQAYFKRNQIKVEMANGDAVPDTSDKLKEYVRRNKKHLTFMMIEYFYSTNQKFSFLELDKLVDKMLLTIHTLRSVAVPKHLNIVSISGPGQVSPHLSQSLFEPHRAEEKKITLADLMGDAVEYCASTFMLDTSTRRSPIRYR